MSLGLIGDCCGPCAGPAHIIGFLNEAHNAFVETGHVFQKNEGEVLTLKVRRTHRSFFRYIGTPADYFAEFGEWPNVSEGGWFHDFDANELWQYVDGSFEQNPPPSLGFVAADYTTTRMECGCSHIVPDVLGTLTWADGNWADKTITVTMQTHSEPAWWGCDQSICGGEPAVITLENTTAESGSVQIGEPTAPDPYNGNPANVVGVCTHAAPDFLNCITGITHKMRRWTATSHRSPAFTGFQNSGRYLTATVTIYEYVSVGGVPGMSPPTGVILVATYTGVYEWFEKCFRRAENAVLVNAATGFAFQLGVTDSFEDAECGAGFDLVSANPGSVVSDTLFEQYSNHGLAFPEYIMLRIQLSNAGAEAASDIIDEAQTAIDDAKAAHPATGATSSPPYCQSYRHTVKGTYLSGAPDPNAFYTCVTATPAGPSSYIPIPGQPSPWSTTVDPGFLSLTVADPDVVPARTYQASAYINAPSGALAADREEGEFEARLTASELITNQAHKRPFPVHVERRELTYEDDVLVDTGDWESVINVNGMPTDAPADLGGGTYRQHVDHEFRTSGYLNAAGNPSVTPVFVCHPGATP